MLFIFAIAMSVIFIILEVVIYQVLIRTLKRKLYRYYRRSRKDLVVLTIISTLTFTLFLVSYSLTQIKGDDPSTIAFKSSFKDNNFGLFIFWIIFRLSMNVMLNFYAYYNIKNINFKDYLSAILFGYRINAPLESTSIFIVKS